jgi:hypothetical protein
MRNGSSDRLFNAELGSLSAEKVFDLYARQIEEELNDPLICNDHEAGIPQLREQERRILAEARRLYKRGGIDALLRAQDEQIRLFGEAIESGEYSVLAI